MRSEVVPNPDHCPTDSGLGSDASGHVPIGGGPKQVATARPISGETPAEPSMTT